MATPARYLFVEPARALAVCLLVVALSGCGQTEPAASAPPTVRLLGHSFWFRSLAEKFAEFAKAPDGQAGYTLERLTDLDWLSSEQYRQTVLALSSIYDARNLPISSEEYGTLQEEVDVIVTDISWVASFARSGWLAPFDESLLDILKAAGVEPIRVAAEGGAASTAPIYAAPITKAANLVFYRKSRFSSVGQARDAWVSGISSGKLPAGSVLTDGQGLYRFFLGLIWSVEPTWPCDGEGKPHVDTRWARDILTSLRRAIQAERTERPPSRSEQFSRLKRCIMQFSGAAGAASGGSPSQSDPADSCPACWLVSTMAQRLLISRMNQPVPLDDIGFLPLTASPTHPGVSLAGGKCLIMTRRLLARDPATAETRRAVQKLVEYLLSPGGQRTLCLDHFEIPVRRGVLSALRPEEVAGVMRRPRFQAKSKAEEPEMSDQERLLGAQILALLRQIDATLSSEESLQVVHDSPLSPQESLAVVQMLEEVLTRRRDDPGAESSSGQEEKTIVDALTTLQERLDSARRFSPPASPGQPSSNGTLSP